MNVMWSEPRVLRRGAARCRVSCVGARRRDDDVTEFEPVPDPSDRDDPADDDVGGDDFDGVADGIVRSFRNAEPG